MKYYKVLNFKSYFEGVELGTEEDASQEAQSGEKPEDYKVGDKVIYIYKGKSREDWDNLSDDEKSKPEEKPASDIVGIKEIEKVVGDTFTFTDKEGKQFTKSKDEILQKQSSESSGEKTQEEPQAEGQKTTESFNIRRFLNHKK